MLRKNGISTDPSSLGPRVSQLESTVTTLSDASKQSQTLVNGLSVINGSLDTPADIQINGRTLVSMGSSVLDATKNYVLANKKTILKWADASTTQGVAKFTGKGEKPAIIHVSNMENKVNASTVENPHSSKVGNAASLLSPSSITGEIATTEYAKITSLDGTVYGYGPKVSGMIAQQLFQFDIIQAIERNVGRIPRPDTAGKVQWVKDNANTFTFNWYGYGSAPSGNIARTSVWNGSSWVGLSSTTASGVILRQSVLSSANIATDIDSNGMVFFLAYADASDGVTASTINTDYVELQIELKQSAILHDPLLALYEVPDPTDYANILTTWVDTDVMNRYPKVQAVQHLQNPYVMAEGENLIPPLTDSAWTLHANSQVSGPYDFTLNATANSQYSTVKVNIVPNQSYTLNHSGNISSFVAGVDANGTTVATLKAYTDSSPKTFTPPSNAVALIIYFSNDTGGSGAFIFSQPMLTLGTVAKPFTPRNPSYLFATAKLGQIGTVKDTLYKSDGTWYVRQAIQKDNILDGSLSWIMIGDFTGFKRFAVLSYPSNSSNAMQGIVTKYNGLSLSRYPGSWTIGDLWLQNGADFNVTISDTETGFGESYNPSTQEIQAYFYGWTAKTVDGTGKPTAWSSLGDGTDAPTQTLAYVSTTKAPNFTPYKLSYVLATPSVVTANVEGEIALNGLTQVQVGSGVIVREKVVPKFSKNIYLINDVGSFYGVNNPLKYKTLKILNMYKNNALDNPNWTIQTSAEAYGMQRAYTTTVQYDSTAEYSVTYLIDNIDNTLANFTNNGTEFKASYDNSLKSVIDTLAERQADLTSISSVNVQAIAELYKRVKALGG